MIWGIGPALQASTHTDDALGNDKWAAVHIGAQGAGFLHATRVLPEPRQAGGARSLVEATVDGTPLGEEEIASIRRELGEEGQSVDDALNRYELSSATEGIVKNSKADDVEEVKPVLALPVGG